MSHLHFLKSMITLCTFFFRSALNLILGCVKSFHIPLKPFKDVPFFDNILNIVKIFFQFLAFRVSLTPIVSLNKSSCNLKAHIYWSWISFLSYESYFLFAYTFRHPLYIQRLKDFKYVDLQVSFFPKVRTLWIQVLDLVIFYVAIMLVGIKMINT